MGFRDVLFFIITAGTNLQQVAAAAAGGASADNHWFIGFFALALPLAICVIALSSRHPEEGGLYVWTKIAFGDFAGFITGWAYWMSNLPYFPAVLYFAAGNALYAGGSRWTGYSSSAPYFIGASLIGLALLVTVTAWIVSRRGGGTWRRRTSLRPGGRGSGIDSIADLGGLAAREAAAAAAAHPFGTFYAAFLTGVALGASPELRDMVRTTLKASVGGDRAR